MAAKAARDARRLRDFLDWLAEKVGPGEALKVVLMAMRKRWAEEGCWPEAEAADVALRALNQGPAPEVQGGPVNQVAEGAPRDRPSMTIEQLRARAQAQVRAGACSEETLLLLCFCYLANIEAGTSFLNFLERHLMDERAAAARIRAH